MNFFPQAYTKYIHYPFISHYSGYFPSFLFVL